MSANDGLAGVKRALLGPSRSEKSDAGGTDRSVPAAPATLWGMWEFRCWLWVKSVTSLDVCPSSVSTTRSQWSCASLRRCSSRACASSCFSGCVLLDVLRVKGRVESKEGLLHRTQTFHWVSLFDLLLSQDCSNDGKAQSAAYDAGKTKDVHNLTPKTQNTGTPPWRRHTETALQRAHAENRPPFHSRVTPRLRT